GLIAGQWLRASRPKIPFRRLLTAGVVALAAGSLLHVTGICPVVKRIWTPSWVLFSGGVCFFLLAAFFWLVGEQGWRKWAFPLVVVGMNSIAAYLIAHLLPDFLISSFSTNLGPRSFDFAGHALEPLMQGAAMLLVYWLILFWMYSKKLFLRI